MTGSKCIKSFIQTPRNCVTSSGNPMAARSLHFIKRHTHQKRSMRTDLSTIRSLSNARYASIEANFLTGRKPFFYVQKTPKPFIHRVFDVNSVLTMMLIWLTLFWVRQQFGKSVYFLDNRMMNNLVKSMMLKRCASHIDFIKTELTHTSPASIWCKYCSLSISTCSMNRLVET